MSPELNDHRASEKRLESGAWGAFAMWIGIALLAGIGWGLSLVGIGVILLGVQIARRGIGLRTDWWAATLGAVFILGPAWEHVRSGLGIHVGLLPILCILAGAALLARAVRAHA